MARKIRKLMDAGRVTAWNTGTMLRPMPSTCKRLTSEGFSGSTGDLRKKLMTYDDLD